MLPGSRLDRRSSWLRQLTRSNALTMALSIVLHAVLFFGFYRVVFIEEAAPARIVIPEARLAPAGAPAGSSAGELPRLNPRPNPQPPGGLRTSVAAGPLSASPLQVSELPVLAVNLAGNSNFVMGGTEGTASSAIGAVGAGAGGGSIMGSAYGTGGGTGGGGGLIGPATSFFGAAGNAYRVAFVVDVSNSLMLYRKDIIREVRDSVRNLTPTQEFAILLAKPKALEEFNPNRLVLANARNKTGAIAFIEGTALVRDVGAADPMAALDKAFSLRPELIYFLSDGEYDDIKDDLLKKVADLHRRNPVKITVISIEPSPRNLPVLEAIAKQTGGHFRPVRLDP